MLHGSQGNTWREICCAQVIDMYASRVGWYCVSETCLLVSSILFSPCRSHHICIKVLRTELIPNLVLRDMPAANSHQSFS